MTWVVGVASAGSLCAIFVSLVSIGVIVNDISSLQDEVHEGMSEFRVSFVLTIHLSVSSSLDQNSFIFR